MRFFAIAITAALLAVSGAVPGATQTTDQNRQFADKLVHQLLGVKPGQVVLINADPTHMALLEDVATSVSATGAFPIINLGSNHMNKLYYQRVPAQYDSLTPKGAMGLVKIADAMVNIDFPADPSVLDGVPPSRPAALGRAANVVTAYVLKRSLPTIAIGNGMLPSDSTAKQFGVGPDVLSSLFWSGLNADYGQIHRDATAVAGMVQSSHSVHLTAPNGTDITFAVNGKAAEINDGIISAGDRAHGGTAVQKQLPAGDVFFLPKAGTANGTVVFGDTRILGTLVTGLTMHVANGKITSMTASNGVSAVNKLYAAGGAGRDEFDLVDFGTNRSMQVPAHGTWGAGPSMAAGYVTAGFGGNVFFGGSDQSPFALSSNVPGATVTVDGKPLIKAGVLAAAT